MRFEKLSNSKRIFLLLAIGLSPLVSCAGVPIPLPAFLPLETIDSTLLGLAGCLLLAMLLAAIMMHRSLTTSMQLKDITTELEAARERLAETSTQLDNSQLELTEKSKRHDYIMRDAGVGIFHMDLEGKCIYLNDALQKMTGLYPKKALKAGLEHAIHTEDRAIFKEAWHKFAVERSKPFRERFRFRKEGEDVYVSCVISRVLNERKDPALYIGWVTNITEFNEENLIAKSITSRYEYFVDETLEGYYQLLIDKPIPLNMPVKKMVKTIMEDMKLAACNDTFASMYGSSPTKMNGQAINEIHGGCGPLKNTESVKAFIEAGFKAIDEESILQDPAGNRLNLMNNMVGLIENNHLVGIWGWQRNTSQQKRERTELTNQFLFMQRVLNSLPADVHVKDTRCRYLYASKKLADRTNIHQEDWIGKTIYEVLPATPKDHDKNAIEVMKNGKTAQSVKSEDVQGKKTWMETTQIPLVSEEGLVEGVIGLSVDVTSRMKQEEETQQLCAQLENHLHERTEELKQSKTEHTQTEQTLKETTVKTKELQKEIEEHQRTEENLQKNEENLLGRQKELETQLSARLEALNNETDKRKKWEDLLAIKETELRSIEEQSNTLARRLDETTEKLRLAENDLTNIRVEIQEQTTELNSCKSTYEQKTSALTETHKKMIQAEHQERKRAETQLTKTEKALSQTEEQFREANERHAAELERSVTEHKEAAEQLVTAMEELDGYKQQFNERIDAETKAIKQELAKKQIREKTLRQHEKELENRIAELEQNLQKRIKEYEELQRNREEDLLQRQQAEQKLAELKKNQESLVAREIQKMDLSVAETRLEEVKLRNTVGNIEQEKEKLKEQLEVRSTELVKITEELRYKETALADAMANVCKAEEDREDAVAKLTREYEEQLSELKSSTAADQVRERLEQELETLKNALEAAEQDSSQHEQTLREEMESLRKSITEREEELGQTRDQLDEAEKRVKETESLAEGLNGEYQQEMEAYHDQTQTVIQLFDGLGEEVKLALGPVVTAAGLIGQADNLSQQQKRDLTGINQRCQRLLDKMVYGSELGHWRAGDVTLQSEPCNLHSLIQEFERKYGSRAEAKQLFFAVSFAQKDENKGVPKMVETDEQKIRKILSILLGYAFDNTDKGRLGLHATRKSGSGDQTLISFDLAYTGNDPQDTLLTEVFDSNGEFEENEDTIDIRHGLSLARRYIDLLRGKVSLEFREGGVTVLAVELPLKEVESADDSSAENGEQAAGAA